MIAIREIYLQVNGGAVVSAQEWRVANVAPDSVREFRARRGAPILKALSNNGRVTNWRCALCFKLPNGVGSHIGRAL